jgi:hypothetical protein
MLAFTEFSALSTLDEKLESVFELVLRMSRMASTLDDDRDKFTLDV